MKQEVFSTRRPLHLLLQIRTRVLNGELASRFRKWYPGFRLSEDEDYEATEEDTMPQPAA